MVNKNSSSAFVKFDRVQKSYDGETLVVKDLNLEVPKGEFLTMLGPSGSGKTTCLMMLAGFETATHGDIMLNGISINNIPLDKEISEKIYKCLVKKTFFILGFGGWLCCF